MPSGSGLDDGLLADLAARLAGTDAGGLAGTDTGVQASHDADPTIGTRSGDGRSGEVPDGDPGDRFRDLVTGVGPGSLDAVAGDHFGPLYDELVGDDDSGDLGRVYTPPGIGRTLARWAVRSADDRVLDPCCGTGAVTVEAYRRLADLGCSHREALERITAVDVDGVAVRLAALALAARDRAAPPDAPFAHHADFFDLHPETDPAPTALLDPRDRASSTDGETFGTFDATVANPPYVRQERFAAGRDRIRAHLGRFGPDGATPYLDGDRAIDRRSDLYCYFLTHATGFLRPGGRLAWIVPTKWMTADYGPSVRRFLYDHYRVEAVVGFRGRVFDDALVDAVLVLAERRADPGRGGDHERRTDPARRSGTATNFVRIAGDADPAAVVRAADADPPIPEGAPTTTRSGSGHRTVSVREAHLAANVDRKVGHYLDAPAPYVALAGHPDTVELGEVATVTRGKKTGANRIFVLDRDDVDSYGVESRFLRPAVKSVREVEGFEHTREDAERWFLDVHDYVERVRSGDVPAPESADPNDGSADSGGLAGPTDADPDGDLERAVRDAARVDGYEGLLSYLDWAEDRPARSNATLDAYDPWFDLGSLDDETAPVLCPQAMDTRRFFVRTGGEVAASNRFLLVDPEGDPDLLAGLLNSTLAKVAVEAHGRVTGGGAVNLSASDLRTLPVVDPRTLAPGERDRVAAGFDRLAAGDRAGLDRIDRTLLDALDLDVGVEDLRETADRRKRIRRGDAGVGDLPVGDPNDSPVGDPGDPLVDDLDDPSVDDLDDPPDGPGGRSEAPFGDEG